MRIIEEHKYDNNSKSFQAGEMTVLQYEKFLIQPEVAVMEILTEFQETSPELNKDEMKSFIEWLTSWSKSSAPKTTAGKTTNANDFHISKGIFMREFHQPYSELENIPMREFLLLIEDLPIISGQKEYDPNRKSERIDGDAIGGLMGELG